MAQETRSVVERLEGRQMIDQIVDDYNAGITSDGMQELLTIHTAAQQVLESRIMGNNGRFRIDNATFLTTTANGELLRMYLGGFIDSDQPMPKLRLNDEGKIVCFGAMRVKDADLAFDYLNLFECGGSTSAWFQWYREDIATPSTEHEALTPESHDEDNVPEREQQAEKGFSKLAKWLGKGVGQPN